MIESRMRTTSFSLLLMVMLTLVLAACGGESKDEAGELPTRVVLPTGNSESAEQTSEATPELTTEPNVETTLSGTQAVTATPIVTRTVSVTITSSNVVGYECPDTTCDVVQRFAIGDVVIVVEVDGEWTLVLTETQEEAYVQSRAIAQQGANLPPSPAGAIRPTEGQPLIAGTRDSSGIGTPVLDLTALAETSPTPLPPPPITVMPTDVSPEDALLTLIPPTFPTQEESDPADLLGSLEPPVLPTP